MKKLLVMMTIMAGAAQGQDFRNPPRAATQAEVDAGAQPRAYVSPLTLANYSGSIVGAPTNVVRVNASGVVTNPAAFWAANSNALNAVVYRTNTITKNAIMRDGLQIYPVSATNIWLDFGRTNGNEQVYVYQSLLATNDVCIQGHTNAATWSLISLNMVASAADRRVLVTTNFPNFDTNGLVGAFVIGTFYSFTLTNGNEFRISAQSNAVTFSTLWATFGQ